MDFKIKNEIGSDAYIKNFTPVSKYMLTVV